MVSTICVHKIILLLGIFELIFGFGIFLCGIINTSQKSRLYKVQHGLWGGSYIMFNALFALMAGLRRSKSAHTVHMILSGLGFIFLVPGMNTLFANEMLSDMFYSYWTDNKTCYDCYVGNNQNYFSYNTSTLNSTSAVQIYECDTIFTSEICHPNKIAAKVEFCAICVGCLSFIFLFLSSSFTCCLICHCCGIRSTVTPNDSEESEFSNRTAPYYSQPPL